MRYSPQDEIRQYYEKLAGTYNLPKVTSFKHTVIAARWDDKILQWFVTIRNNTTGSLHYYTTTVLIPCIGQLNRPKWANIPGASNFKGEVFHTAQWDHTVDLTNKRVSIIGTGPSAGQVIPMIAKTVKELNVYQRSPPHVLPRNDYYFSSLTKAVFKYVPLAWRLHHLYLYVDSEFGPYLSNHIPSAENAGSAKAAQDHMESYIPADRPDLRKAFTPDYPYGCKRPMFLDSYYTTYLRDNVHLHTSKPKQITENSIITDDGTETQCDVLIWSTGFSSQDVMGHVDVTGKGGVKLKDQFGDHAKAFLGMSTYNFPNLFFGHGPATSLLWGSLTFMFETQALWNTNMVAKIYNEEKRGKRVAYAAKKDIVLKYNEEIQVKLQGMALADQRCMSYYKNERGISTTNYPWRLADYWWRMLWIEWAKFDKEEIRL